MVKPLGFGEKLPSSGNNFLRVKQKGDKVQFKIGGKPGYLGKHFIQNEDNTWDVPDCARIMNNEECERCNTFFKLKAKSKKMKDSDPKESERLNNEARNYAATTEFYFPILDRADGKFKVLQTTMGVKNKLDALYMSGVDVMNKEWLLANTGEVGGAKYILSAIDSADVKDMSEEEQAEWKLAQEFDVTTISQGGGDDDEDGTVIDSDPGMKMDEKVDPAELDAIFPDNS